MTRVRRAGKRTPVSSPTHSASKQCVFFIPKRSRFQRVRPPLQLPIGKPSVLSASTSAYLVVLTAAASRSGARACLSTSGCPHSAAVLSPLVRLQSRQLSTKLLTLFDPPRLRGSW